MSSFILPFRGWLAAALAFVSIELAVYAIAYPSIFDRTDFLQFSFSRDETPQRLFVLEKIKAFADSETDDRAIW